MTARAAVALLVLSGCGRSAAPVEWSAEPVARSVAAGGITSLRVRAEIDRGWYVYSISQPPGGPIATSVWLPAGQPFSMRGTVTGPAPETEFDRVFGITVEKYRGTVDLTVPVQISPGAARSGQPIRLRVRYQACNDEICLPPRTVELSPLVSVSPE